MCCFVYSWYGVKVGVDGWVPGLVEDCVVAASGEPYVVYVSGSVAWYVGDW